MGVERPAPGAAKHKSRLSSPASDAVELLLRSHACQWESTHCRSGGFCGWRWCMTDLWNQCEGQVIDNKFRLRHYFGGIDDSAVFLTQLPDRQSQKAAIKFIPAGPTADLQLSLWLRVMQLAHPNLLRIFDIGRCRLGNRDRLYVVMEHAEEDLSQILPQRPLTTSEARAMLEPVLDVLVYLHGHGLVHSHLKPSNILATDDQLKLSSENLFPSHFWILRVTLSSAIRGDAGPLPKLQRASTPALLPLLPRKPYLLWRSRSRRFRRSPLQSCKCQSPTYPHQERKRRWPIRKPRACRNKLLYSPTTSFLLLLCFYLSR